MLTAETVVERELLRQPVELTDQPTVAAACEVGIDPVAQNLDAEVFEARDVGCEREVIDEICERGTIPQGQRLSKGRRSSGRVDLHQFLAASAKILELDRIDCISCRERVSAALRRQRITELGPELRDIALNGLLRGGRSIVTPHRLDQATARHHPTPGRDEQSQNKTLLGPTQGNLFPVSLDSHGPQDPIPHSPTVAR